MRLFITGANRGLGYELAAAACAQGHSVIAGARQPEQAEKLLHLKEQYVGLLSIVPLDVASEESVRLASEEAGRLLGPNKLDGIINSAAVLMGRDERIEELDLAKVEATFRVNLFGPMRVMKYFLPLLTQDKSACVINISSEAGSFSGAYGGDYSYALSKSSLNMFTAQLRNLLARQGAFVYAIHPGWMRTDMGGPKAPLDAREAAESIIALADRRIVPDSQALFVDHKGCALPI